MKGVLVTTVHKGVFFGYTDKEWEGQKLFDLKNARMVLYWPAETHGVLGLAANGPNDGCRISPRAPLLTLSDITSVALCAEEAVKRFEDAPWSK